MPKPNPNRLRRGATRLPAITITVDDDLARAVEKRRGENETAAETLRDLIAFGVHNQLTALRQAGKRLRLEQAQREVEAIKAELEGQSVITPEELTQAEARAAALAADDERAQNEVLLQTDGDDELTYGELEHLKGDDEMDPLAGATNRFVEDDDD